MRLTTLPTLETSVVSQKTGMLNTARVRLSQDLLPISKSINAGPLLTISSERLLQPLPDMTLQVKPLTSLVHNANSHVAQPTEELSQLKTTLPFIPETLELSEEDNTCSLPLLMMVQDSLSMETSLLTTGVFTEEEEEYTKSEKGLRYQLIQDRLIKDNDVQVQFEDLKEFSKQMIKVQMAQFGQMNPTDQELEDIAARILGNQDEVRRLTDQLLSQKLLELFKEKANLKKKEVTYENFVKEVYGDSH